MTPEEAFLADIAAHPEDDALRLIFADWLDDNKGSGQGKEAKQAREWVGYIRRQVEAARCPRTDPRYWELNHRLWAVKPPAAARALVPRDLRRSVRYDRGFPDGLDVSLRRFLAIAEGLPACPAPLYRLDLSQAGRQFPELVKRPELLRFRRLRLSSSKLPDARGVALAACSYLANLTSLEFAVYGPESIGKIALVTSPYLANLRELVMTWDSPGPDASRALAESPILAKLEKLTLYTLADSASAASLVQSPYLTHLRELTLCGVDNDRWLQPLVDGSLPALTALDLPSLSSPASVLPAFLRSARFAALTRLNLGHAEVSPGVWLAFPNDPGPPTLTLLYSPRNSASAAAFVRSSVLGRCLRLEMRYAALGASELRALALSPFARHLRNLTLSGSRDQDARLTGEHLRTFVESPHLAGLISLELWGDYLTDEGLRALKQATFAGSLRRLALRGNSFSARALVELANPTAFPNLLELQVVRPAEDQERTLAVLRERFGSGFFLWSC